MLPFLLDFCKFQVKTKIEISRYFRKEKPEWLQYYNKEYSYE